MVDWRNAAMRMALDNNHGNVDQALAWAEKQNPNELRRLLDLMDETVACELNDWYRAKRTVEPLSRAADLDMALFGLSLIAWPMPQAKSA